MLITEVQIGQKVSFEVYPSTIYGSNHNGVTVTGFVDAATAQALGYDIFAMHQNVYPSLPAGTPDDPTQYSYVMVVGNNGGRILLGSPWIVSDSIRIDSGKTLTLVFQNLDEQRKNRIIEACKRNNENPDSVVFN